MAVFHLSVKVISRASGRRAVAAVAYRGTERLHDDRLDSDLDFTNKDEVVHSEVMLPEGAPLEFADREKLWNAVGAAEKRKDAQLSRAVEFEIPRKMNKKPRLCAGWWESLSHVEDDCWRWCEFRTRNT